MRFVLAVMLVGATAAVGCGMGDDAGIDRRDGGGADIWTGDGGSAFALSIEGSAFPKVGDSITVVAVVSNIGAPAQSYAWEVLDPESAAVSFTENTVRDRITFTPKKAGTYTVSCTVTLSTGATLYDSAGIQVQEGGKTLTYTARIIPAPGSGLPPTDESIEVGRVSQTSLNWQLKEGKPVALQVTDDKGTALPAVVRLLQSGQDPEPREFHLSTGSATVRVNGTFDALFLPSGGTVPAQLQTKLSAATMAGSWKVSLDPGVEVSGAVSRSDGSKLVGAKVTVHTRSGGVLVPSTIASCDAQGVFKVRTRTGQASLTVVPPDGSGLPVAVVDDPGLSVSGPTSGWSFSFAQAKPVTVSGKVTRSDGSSPAAGARVVLMTNLSAVGSLGTGASSSLVASGLFRRVLSTTSGGELIDPATQAKQLVLPQGSYQVEVWPGVAEAKEGYFLKTVDLTTSSTASLNVSLSARVTLSGRVVDQQGKSVKARVMATAETGTFTTVSDDQGKFQLYLNNKSSYSLIIRSTQRTLSTYIDPQLTIDGSKQLSTIQLPPAVLLAGKLTTTSNMAISGSLIRIWCSSADCPSQAVVDETVVLKDGHFELRVPPTEAQ